MLKRGQLIRTLALVALSGTMACANPRPRVGVVYVAGRPPVERVEVIAVQPGPSHVWIGGHWAWRGADYVWIPGHWEIPGAGFRTWAPGHWAHDRFGWYWIEGRWR